jgi:hypothetical protein
MPISTDIKTALEQGTGLYVTLVRLEARAERGGDVLAYTLHTRDVNFEGTDYVAAPFEPSKTSRNSGTQVDNATVTHLLGDLFTRLNLRGGKWSGAKIDLMAIDLLEPFHRSRSTQTRADRRCLDGRDARHHRTTWIDAAPDAGNRRSHLETLPLQIRGFRLHARPYSIHIQRDSRDRPQQPADHGDNVSKPDGYFKYGRVIFTSGLNIDLEMETINNTGQMVTFVSTDAVCD